MTMCSLPCPSPWRRRAPAQFLHNPRRISDSTRQPASLATRVMATGKTACHVDERRELYHTLLTWPVLPAICVCHESSANAFCRETHVWSPTRGQPPPCTKGDPCSLAMARRLLIPWKMMTLITGQRCVMVPLESEKSNLNATTLLHRPHHYCRNV